MKGEPYESPDSDSPADLLAFYNEKRSAKTDINAAWMHLQDFLSEKGYDFEEIGVSEAAEYGQYLREVGLKPNTYIAYYSSMRTFTEWFCQRGVFDYNPFSIAKEEELDFQRNETVKRQVDLSELQDAIKSTRKPQRLLLITLLLKTGLRLSEAHNLDLRDVHIEHPISKDIPQPRSEIRQKPDTIFVDSSINEEEVYNGEKRTHSNKKKSTRAIPIDSELKDTLVWWIALAPPSNSPAKPLFRNTVKKLGLRIGYPAMYSHFVSWAKERNLHEWGNELNISPHWCRHWFTTVLRQRISPEEVELGTVKGYVKSLRGDSDSDTIDIYTHDWSDENWVRDVYVNNIPQLYTGLNDGHYETIHSDRNIQMNNG